MEIIRDYTKNIMNKNILTFGYPELLTSGTYFTKILYNNHPLYIQTPKCKTKNGFIKSNKKIYTELLFQNTEEDMLGWFEYLDEYCKDFMLLKSADWFNSSLTKEDIDSLWISTFKLYKSGKNILIKVNVPMDNNIPLIKLYDESERNKQMDDVNETTKVQTILEICGIKFTSKTYQLNVELKQIMILNNNANNIEHPLFNKCLIKPIHIDTFSNELPEDDMITITPTHTNNIDISNPSTNNNIPIKITNINNEKILKTGIMKPEDASPVNPQLNIPPSSQPPLQSSKDINNDDYIAPDIENTNNNTDYMSDNLEEIQDLTFDSFIDLEQIPIDNLGTSEVTKEDIKIKNPNVIYLEMYNNKLTNAKQLLYASKNLFQEAKLIKEKYKLDISENINEYISD
jgi:hypothetical protein